MLAHVGEHQRLAAVVVRGHTAECQEPRTGARWVPKPRLTAEARRALQMLANSEAGCPQTLMLPDGFTRKLITGLVEAKLVTKESRPVKAGAKLIELTTLRIAPAGRVALGQ